MAVLRKNHFDLVTQPTTLITTRQGSNRPSLILITIQSWSQRPLVLQIHRLTGRDSLSEIRTWRRTSCGRSARTHSTSLPGPTHIARSLLRRMDSVQKVKHDMVLYFKHYLHFHHDSAARRAILTELGSGKFRHIIGDTIHKFSDHHLLLDCGFEAYVGESASREKKGWGNCESHARSVDGHGVGVLTD